MPGRQGASRLSTRAVEDGEERRLFVAKRLEAGQEQCVVNVLPSSSRALSRLAGGERKKEKEQQSNDLGQDLREDQPTTRIGRSA